MATLSIDAMRAYLMRSITASENRNKLNGLRAELDFRAHLTRLGFGNRVSQGGWIFRKSKNDFGTNTIVVFPEVVEPGVDYPLQRNPPNPAHHLHTVCATFQQSGIHAYYCFAEVERRDDAESVSWRALRLGVPMTVDPIAFPAGLEGLFVDRSKRHNFLTNHADLEWLPEANIAGEFSKESVRISFRSRFLAEDSDVDGIFWGNQFTYPIEIKEKTAAQDAGLGEWFGLDVGPFVKLAYYAAKRGNLNSLFVVREIDNEEDRNLVGWWFVKFEELACYASWVPQSGGTNMRGGGSTVVRIPKHIFRPLNRVELDRL